MDPDAVSQRRWNSLFNKTPKQRTSTSKFTKTPMTKLHFSDTGLELPKTEGRPEATSTPRTSRAETAR